MNKVAYVLFVVALGTHANFVFGKIVGSSPAYERMHEIESMERGYEYKLKKMAETESEIVRLGMQYEDLEEQVAAAKREKQCWQKASEERISHLASLRAQLSDCTQTYELKMSSLKIVHDKRMRDVEQNNELMLAELNHKQDQEEHLWAQALAKEDFELNLLCTQKQNLNARADINNELLLKRKRDLADIVIQSIRSGRAATQNVVGVLGLLGHTIDILHGAEHARNVSLLVALILSGHFKAADLSTAESNYQSIPKSFFRAVKFELVQTKEEALSENVFSSWVQQLERLGQRRFLCYSC